MLEAAVGDRSMEERILPSLRILQMSDVHWPKLWRQVDTQDEGISEAVKRTVLDDERQARSARLSVIEKLENQDAVLVTGDLTSQADLEQYRAFLKEFASWVPDVAFLKKVFVVVGNHDIDRKDHSDEDVFRKFDALARALKELEYPCACGPELGAEEVGSEGSRALVLSLNSCVCCGMRRLLNPLGGRAGNLRARKLVGSRDGRLFEELDTPAFDIKQLEAAVRAIDDNPGTSIPVLLAHHNLLPQVNSRAVPYSELLNGGLARGLLLELGRPVLYLHGHVHMNQVEIVTHPFVPDSRIVSIGVPNLEKGFNCIVIMFSRAGRPLGCRIEALRFKSSATGVCLELVPDKTIRIPFWDGGLVSHDKLSADACVVYDSLPPTFRVQELRVPGVPLEHVPACLLELEWYGLVLLEREPLDHHVDWNGRRVAS